MRTLLACWLLCIGFSPSSQTFAEPPKQSKRSLTAEDLLSVRYVTGPAVSPTGTRVAYRVAEPPEVSTPRGTGSSHLWITSTDGSSSPEHFAAGHTQISRLLWSPDGRYLAFLSLDNSGHKQIWLLPNDGDRERPVTKTSDGVISFRWAPDGNQIAYTTPESLPGDSKHHESDAIVIDGDLKFARLWVANVESGESSKVFDGPEHVAEFEWSPHQNELAAIVSTSPHEDDRFNNQSLVVIDRQKKQIVRTLSKKTERWTPEMSWSPDGKFILFSESLPGRQSAAYRLAAIPAAGGDPQYPLAQLESRGTPLYNIKWSQDSSHLWVQYADKTRCRLGSVDVSHLQTGKPVDHFKIQQHSDSIMNFWNWSANRDKKTIAFGAERFDHPPELTILRDGKLKQLTNLNPWLSKIQFGQVQEIHWKNKSDGQDLYGVLVTPPGDKTGTQYPMVTIVHGGPFGFSWTGWLGYRSTLAQYLATHGYAVFLPNFRGSMGQGWKFAEANYLDTGGGDFEDIMSGIDKLVDQGIADPNRLGIGGSSYGGYMTAMATTKTSRFQAAIVDAGITEVLSQTLNSDATPAYNKFYGNNVLTEQELLEKFSPLKNVERCQTPTLVIHGENDIRVPISQGQQWYKALRLRGVETEMVVYPREGHGYSERAHQIDWFKRSLAWYDKHLKEE